MLGPRQVPVEGRTSHGRTTRRGCAPHAEDVAQTTGSLSGMPPVFCAILLARTGYRTVKWITMGTGVPMAHPNGHLTTPSRNHDDPPTRSRSAATAPPARDPTFRGETRGSGETPLPERSRRRILAHRGRSPAAPRDRPSAFAGAAEVRHRAGGLRAGRGRASSVDDQRRGSRRSATTYEAEAARAETTSTDGHAPRYLDRGWDIAKAPT